MAISSSHRELLNKPTIGTKSPLMRLSTVNAEPARPEDCSDGKMAATERKDPTRPFSDKPVERAEPFSALDPTQTDGFALKHPTM